MRYVSRVERTGSDSNLFFLRPGQNVVRDEPGLTAFRGLIIAASLSALFWGVCLTAIWVMRVRS